MKFAVIVDYNPDDPKVPVVRPSHREYLTGLRANGKLVDYRWLPPCFFNRDLESN